MLNRFTGLVLVGGVLGIAYAGGLADKQVREKCGSLPPGISQVCGFIQLPQTASTIFWSGLVGGSGAGALVWLLLKGGNLTSRNIAYTATLISLILAGHSIIGGKMPKASASSVSNASQGSFSPSQVTELTPRRKAFLSVIAYAEGTFIDGEIQYDIKFGGGKIADLSRHPETVVVRPSGSKLSSDAAGFAQFLSTTFLPLQRRHPNDIPDFTPQSQRNATLHLLNEQGILRLVDEGSTAQAINKACKIWASFPCENGKGYYGQGIKPLSVLTDFHNKQLKN